MSRGFAFLVSIIVFWSCAAAAISPVGQAVVSI
jgi:hypothetical protein